MLNLMRFRDVADYTANPELTPEVPISGAEAFNRYIEHTLPFLRESGGEIMFLGDGGEFLIGPEDERWDLVMMIEQRAVVSCFFKSSRLHGRYRASYCSDRRFTPSAYDRTYNTELIGGEHNHEHSESQRRRIGL
jgi:hypothetical protein